MEPPQDAPHRLRSRAKEVGLVFELLSAKLEPSLVHEGRWLQGVTFPFAGHLRGGQAAQFIVNQGQQLVCSVWFSAFDGGENLRDFVHKPGRR